MNRFGIKTGYIAWIIDSLQIKHLRLWKNLQALRNQNLRETSDL